jgi:hypothetical protein
MVVAGLTAASGAGVVHFKQVFHDATQTFPSTVPCTGVPGNVTLNYNGVVHGMFLTSGHAAGTGKFTATQTGTFVFVPDNSSLVSYTGKFTTWFGNSVNLKSNISSSTLTIHAIGSDGSTLKFHDVMHITIIGLPNNPSVGVSFDKPSCG